MTLQQKRCPVYCVMCDIISLPVAMIWGSSSVQGLLFPPASVCSVMLQLCASNGALCLGTFGLALTLRPILPNAIWDYIRKAVSICFFHDFMLLVTVEGRREPSSFILDGLKKLDFGWQPEQGLRRQKANCMWCFSVHGRKQWIHE